MLYSDDCLHVICCFQEGLPLQFSKDLLGPTSTTGINYLKLAYTLYKFQHGVSCDYGRIFAVVSTAKVYGTSQDSNVLGGPSLQRGVIRGPPPASEGQRRKRAHKPPIIPSVPSPLQTAPAGAISTPALVPHIKWQGISCGSSRYPLFINIFFIFEYLAFLHISDVALCTTV